MTTGNEKDFLSVRYGQKIRLYAVSAYADIKSFDVCTPMGIGYYEKNGRHGVLNCVPPLGSKLDELFVEDEYLILDPFAQHQSGDVVEYGHTLVLVNQNGMVWNNKTGGITGYIGPRPRNIPGEMYVSFHLKSDTIPISAPYSSTSSTTTTSPLSSSYSSSSSNNGRKSTTSTVSSGRGEGPIQFGDSNVIISVVESNRHSSLFNKRLTNFKKTTSHIKGGYICCDGKGFELSFTISPVKPKIEQISMLNKLIHSYHYGQKIALPLNLIEQEQAEILFQLSNQVQAILPASMLQQQLLQHVQSSKETSEFTLGLQNAPGKLLLRILGTAPSTALSMTTNASFSLAEKKKNNIFYKQNHFFSFFFLLFSKFFKKIPWALFVFFYAFMVRFLWKEWSKQDPTRGSTKQTEEIRREISLIVLVLLPLFYLAVKIDHPFLAFLDGKKKEKEEQEQEQEDKDKANEPQKDGSLKLMVVEYRFNRSEVVSIPRTKKKKTWTLPPEKCFIGPDSTYPPLPERFLIAEKGNQEKAMERWKEFLIWRQKEDINTILQKPSPHFQFIKQNYPHFYHKRGKQNEPVYYEKPGKINLKNLKMAGLKLEDLLHNYIMLTEFLWQVLEPDDNAKCISVVDIDGIGISDFGGEVVDYIRKTSAVSGRFYPERCAYIFVINVPSWFNIIWNTIKVMIDEVTREKVIIVRGKANILEQLSKKIPLENIPVEYGGKSDEEKSPEEQLFFQLVAFLNQESNAPTKNPIETYRQQNPLLLT
jgi:hypothetical protein